MRARTNLNLTDVSRKTFWQTMRNINMILRLKKAKEIHYLYCIPFGGCKESLAYNLSAVIFTH